MSRDINVTQRTQRIHIAPSTGSVTVENAGPIGPGGPLTSLIQTGAGSPEGVVTADPGVLYLNTSGGASTTLYVKESGVGNTGWVAK